MVNARSEKISWVPPPPPPSLLPLRYDAGYGAERAQRERPGHRVVGVEHREDPLEELVDHGYLVEVTLTLRWRGIFQ